ncbi:Transcription factor FER-like IRON DEFICIENCY-INDUCED TRANSCRIPTION FACTOR [Vitis vinifera]|uniref:Transcription factor FER-like IRON DEFICIENCY-INDUCED TRANSCRIPTION FACTOR n=1 Tax=Vitis vinifera TaxID=29760 RepID=A0A438F2S0_VITVI|nr:Transcription factor FER-like IRON DEFICIENCY-INDUCED TRANSCRIPTION FACTOR [Vitis vinifera]
MDRRDASAGTLPNVTDFGFHDFINDPNFEQLIELIRGESADSLVKFCPNYDCEHMNGCLDDNQFGSSVGELFEFDPATATATATVSNPDSVIDSLPSIDGEMKGGEEMDGEDSSGNTTTTPTKGTKVDRSRTLISERRRRVRMKEKLYALRSLVPNITKMDKASIVGDAVLYVQQLQMQAKKLKAEIAGLESSLVLGAERYNGLVEIPKKIQVACSHHPMCGKIFQMDVFQVEERGFYVRLACNRGERVAVSLYKALESLTGFNIQSSNLATFSETFVLTFTLNVRECDESMNLPNLKLWLTGALLNQGFEFKTLPSS